MVFQLFLFISCSGTLGFLSSAALSPRLLGKIILKADRAEGETSGQQL